MRAEFGGLRRVGDGPLRSMADDLDARMRTLSSHTGGEFQAGQLGHRNGQAPNRAEMPVVNARDDRDITAPIQVGTTAPQRAHHTADRKVRYRPRLLSLLKPPHQRRGEGAPAACATSLQPSVDDAIPARLPSQPHSRSQYCILLNLII